MSGSLEESDSKAGFYYDLKFLTSLAYIVFIIFGVLSRLVFSVEFGAAFLVFLSIFTFMDLQEFVEIKVPRHGWVSRDTYRLASVFLVTGVWVVPIADSLMNSGIITRLPTSISVAIFLLSMVLIIIPILGLVFVLDFYLDFYRSIGISPWKKDKELIETYSKHSFFYSKLIRRKKQI